MRLLKGLRIAWAVRRIPRRPTVAEIDQAWQAWCDAAKAGLRADMEIEITEDNWRDPPWPEIQRWNGART